MDSLPAIKTKGRPGRRQVGGLVLAGLLWCASAAQAERYNVPLLVPAGTPGGPQGVLRILNDTAESGHVAIYAIDDAGIRTGPATFTLNASAASEFTVTDLQSGNATLGLSGGIGTDVGDARLEIETDLQIVPLAFIRASDGALSAMHDTVRSASTDGSGRYVYEVPVFNLSTEMTQVSRLRLINPGDEAAAVSIEGRDDDGTAASGGTVELTLAGGAARTLTAQQLEAGESTMDATEQPTATDGTCDVGLLLEAGERCTYPGTSDAFTVTDDGRGRFLFFTSGGSINLSNSTVNGQTYDFAASHQGDGVWRIDRIEGRTEASGGGDTDAGGSDTGSGALTGRLGAGIGKWRLTVSSDRPLEVVNIVASTAGYWNNLSTTAVAGAAPPDRPAFNERFVGASVTSESSTGSSTIELADGERFTETRETEGATVTHMGSYGYTGIGPDAGQLMLEYDDGDACRANLYFATRTSGWFASRCTGSEDSDGDWFGGGWSVDGEEDEEGDGDAGDAEVAETTYGVNDVLPGVPTSGSFEPAVTSGGSVTTTADGTTVALNDGGYIELNDGTRYTCTSADGCSIVNGTVTAGTVTGRAPGAGEVDRFPSFRNAAAPGDQSYTAGTAIDTLTLPEASGGNGTLTYSLSPSVPGLSFNAAARQLTGTPSTAGTHAMTYTVTDEDGDTDTLGFTVTVSAGTSAEGALGVCQVGMTLMPGQSCTYPGTTDAFSVNERGRGSFLGRLAGIRIRIDNETIDGRVYDFEASHQGDGVWRIDRIAGSTEPSAGTGTDVSPGDSSTGMPTTADDRAALVALYNATDGENWANKTNWLSSAPIGHWHGVTVGENGRVTRLSLNENRLTGTIPAEVGSLSGLEELHLGFNELSGPIPAELGRLANLDYLYLSWNRLTGTIPADLGGLSNLETLDLRVNRLSGPIPVEFSGLSNLRYLGLSSNRLSGPIPPELGEMTALWYVDLAYNQLTGAVPAELTALVNLIDLNLASNLITDISTLALDAGWGAGVSIDVSRNPLNDAAFDTDIPALKARGVTVNHDVRLVDDFPDSRLLHIYNDNVIVMQVDEDVGTKAVLGELDAYASDFYAWFEDQFDYLMLLSHTSGAEGSNFDYAGAYISVMNDTDGIGVSKFLDSSYGSAGRLRGVIHFPSHGSLQWGPALHELLHAWANFAVPTSAGSHWGFSSANGQLGGFDIANLVDLGGGRWTAGGFGLVANGGNGVPYSPIELYFAGLIQREEVPDLWVSEDGEWLRDEDGVLMRTEDGHGIFTANNVRTWTIADIVARNGERIPALAERRHQRAAAILLVDDNRLPADVLQRVSEHASWLGFQGEDSSSLFNFYEATGGRSTLTLGDLAQLRKSEAASAVDLPASYGVVPPPRMTTFDELCGPFGAPARVDGFRIAHDAQATGGAADPRLHGRVPDGTDPCH